MHKGRLFARLSRSEGRICSAKWPADRGVFPGQWPYPAAAWSRERIEEALRRKYAKSLA